MKALVRRPSPRLGDGIVTHIARSSVDAARAFEQWCTYKATLEAAGWETLEAPPADEFPDGVFVEDALVVVGGVAVVTRSGAEARRGETGGLDELMRSLGYRIGRIEEPATLDGGDVLRAGGRLLVGTGARTNEAGATQLAEITGARAETEPVRGVLHLKTAKTALPDGTMIAANVLDLGAGRVMVSSDRDASEVAARGFEPVLVDISELEKLEAGVTCLSVLLISTIQT